MTEPLLSIGAPRAERADAARNRRHLLATARAMLASQGAAALTMDALAEQAGLGKGTVFRRFGSRAGIFQALLDDDERAFQQQVLTGPPPLGPGAPPLDRLIAYGQARIDYLRRNREIARHALDGSQPIPAGSTPLSRLHIRSLLGQLDLGPADLDVLAMQLTAALDGPLLLYLSADLLSADGPGPRSGHPGPAALDRVSRGWQDLVTRVATPGSGPGQP